MKVFIKILKIIAGVILGLILSFISVVFLDAVLSDGNPFGKNSLNVWAIAPIVAGWIFLFEWFLLRRSKAKDLQTQGLKYLPESISKLIDGIIDAMQYRKSVRAEVRQELTDHFTDAVADCDNEEEKQQCIQELIEGFGDVELLGTLLRRAKKRCRPLWRTMVVRFFQFVGLSFVLLILYVGWFFTGKPSITINYVEKMNQMVRPVADESENAWPFYKQAAEKRVKYEEKNEDEKFDFHPTMPSPFTRSEEDRQIIKQLISDNQESLNLIRKGNQKTYYWQVYGTEVYAEDNEMIFMLMPHLSDYKNLTFLMCWRGLLGAEQGDFQKAFDDVLEVYSFGQHLRGQNTTLIEQLVAMSFEWTSTEILRMLLAEHGKEIDVQVLNSAQKKLGAKIADKDFSISIESEKLLIRDEAQRCFTQSRFGKSHLYLPRLRELGALDIDKLEVYDKEAIAVLIKGGLNVLFTHPDKEQTLKEVEQLYGEIQRLSTITPATVKSQGYSIDSVAEKAMEKSIFLGTLMPALTKLINYSHRSRVDSEATLAILAIMRYENEHGKYPESLDVLVDKGFLKKVPIDPFSDEPLVYKKAEGGFLLYSVGLNFTDDGGVPGDYRGTNKNPSARRWTDTGDAVFWPADVR